MIPAPYFSLVETSKGDDPAIVVVNGALREFACKYSYAWHLRITVECRDLGERGMPSPEEVAVLEKLESRVSESLGKDENAIFLARITCRGERDLIFRVRDPDVADSFLQMLVNEQPPLRELNYFMEQDPKWDLAQPELDLLQG